MLNPPHFNGMNTSLKAFSQGVPVETLPTGLQRGRHTLGMYRRMDYLECVAADGEQYAAIALWLAADRAARAAASAQILARCGVLFNDAAVADEFARFFRESTTAAITH